MRRLQPQEATADHHCIAALLGGSEHLVHVIQVAKRHHTGQVVPWNRNDEGIGTSRYQKLVIGLDAAGFRDHGLCRPIDLHHWIAADQNDAVAVVPILPVYDDFLEALFACEDRGKHDPVVIHAGLGAEYRHIETVRVAGEDFLHRTASGHAVSDYDELLAHEPGTFEICRCVHHSPPG